MILGGVVFDLRRISTTVSTTGTVHICVVMTDGMKTLCGLDLANRQRPAWGQNYGDRQPSCTRCVIEATQNPVAYPHERAAS